MLDFPSLCFVWAGADVAVAVVTRDGLLTLSDKGANFVPHTNYSATVAIYRRHHRNWVEVPYG